MSTSEKSTVLVVVDGDLAGENFSLDVGTCRLLGRNLAGNETAVVDVSGRRFIDDAAQDIVTNHLRGLPPPVPGLEAPTKPMSLDFERQADIVLADTAISRAHAMIFLDYSGLGVIDLGSTNGCHLNGALAGSARLAPGDELTVGKTTLLVELVDD